METCLANKFLHAHKKNHVTVQTAGIHLRKQWLAFIVSSARSEVQVIFYIWKLLYSVASPIFLVIFSASLSGSDDFVLFDSLDGNSAYLQMFYAICESLYSFFRNLNLGGFYKQMLLNVVASWNSLIFILSDDI